MASPEQSSCCKHRDDQHKALSLMALCPHLLRSARRQPCVCGVVPRPARVASPVDGRCPCITAVRDIVRPA
jgi:hypothetical protein